MARAEGRRRLVILTPAQLQAVIAGAAPTYRPVIAFLAGTGCRLGEALGLTWADVDLRERSATIDRQLDRHGRRVPVKTANGRRTIELPGALVTLLAAHKLAATDTTPAALVFASVTNGPLGYRSVARRLVAACRSADVPVVSPHAMRHAHASALLVDGWDLPAVSRRLGHGSVAITPARTRICSTTPRVARLAVTGSTASTVPAPCWRSRAASWQRHGSWRLRTSAGEQSAKGAIWLYSARSTDHRGP